jgi:hypothetical protein
MLVRMGPSARGTTQPFKRSKSQLSGMSTSKEVGVRLGSAISRSSRETSKLKIRARPIMALFSMTTTVSQMPWLLQETLSTLKVSGTFHRKGPVIRVI